MSFKDKLKTIKKGKATPEKSQDIFGEEQEDMSSFSGLDDLDDFAIDTNPVKSKSTSKVKKPKTPKSKSNISTLKRNIILLATLLVFLLGVLVYFFMQSSNDTVDSQPAEDTPALVKQEVKKPVQSVDINTPDTAEDGIVEPNSDEQGGTVAGADPLAVDPASEIAKLEETIDLELPVNKIQAAEEMDMFKDEIERLDEHEKELTSQISDQEQLSTLYEEKIKNLEQQIKDAE